MLDALCNFNVLIYPSLTNGDFIFECFFFLRFMTGHLFHGEIRNKKETRWFEMKKMQDISALLLPRKSNTCMTSIFTHLFHEFPFPSLE